MVEERAEKVLEEIITKFSKFGENYKSRFNKLSGRGVKKLS